MLGHAQTPVHITTEKHLYNINHAMYTFNISGKATDAREGRKKKEKNPTKQINHPHL